MMPFAWQETIKSLKNPKLSLHASHAHTCFSIPHASSIRMTRNHHPNTSTLLLIQRSFWINRTEPEGKQSRDLSGTVVGTVNGRFSDCLLLHCVLELVLMRKNAIVSAFLVVLECYSTGKLFTLKQLMLDSLVNSANEKNDDFSFEGTIALTMTIHWGCWVT